MRYFFVLSVLCTISAIHPVIAQINVSDTLYAHNIISALCNDSLSGRGAGSRGEMYAVQMIEEEFSKLQLQNYFKGGYSESFIFIDEKGEILVSRNIAAYIDHQAEKTILIMAHYDHLGLGGVQSLSYTNSSIHYGADDNASGIAVMLMTAGYLKNKSFSAYNYLLLATGAHEPGNFGSGAFVRKYGHSLQKIALVINVDMVGRYMQNNIPFNMHSNDAGKMFFSSIDLNILLLTYKINIRELESGDHTPFENAGFPVIHITTGRHDDYHKISDTPDKINYSGLYEIAGFILELLKQNSNK